MTQLQQACQQHVPIAWLHIPMGDRWKVFLEKVLNMCVKQWKEETTKGSLGPCRAGECRTLGGGNICFTETFGIRKRVKVYVFYGLPACQFQVSDQNKDLEAPKLGWRGGAP